MSEDKEQRTEEATPRRRSKAREEGQVAKSQDISAVVTFAAGMGVLLFTGISTTTSMAHFTSSILGRLESNTPLMLVSETKGILIELVVPVAFACFLGAILAGYGMVGWNPTLKPLTPDIKKFDPVKGIKKVIFSLNSIVEVLKSLAKIIFIGAVVADVIYRQIIGSASLTAATSGQVLQQIGQLAFDIAWRALIGMILIAIIDWVWQKRQFEKSIKMTKQEIKEEHKDMEGDPHVKGKRRQKMREFAGKRAQAVSEAAVVVVNPTHVAVALKYTPPEDAAPTVVAKGIDEGARRVREEARRHNVPIHHDPPLARKLARRVPTGKTIPPELYRAVAAVLAAVLQARHRARAS